MAQIKFISGRRRKPRQLGELMQTLPQELFDKIYDLTFTAEPGVRDLGYITSEDDGRTFQRQYLGQQFLGADTRALLQVDRASRAKFATSYYGEGSMFLAHTPYAAQTWYVSIDPQHESLIADLPPKLSSDGFSAGSWRLGPANILWAGSAGWGELIAEIRKVGIQRFPTDQDWKKFYPLRLGTNDSRPMRWSGGCGQW